MRKFIPLAVCCLLLNVGPIRAEYKAPRNHAELQGRLAELRAQYAPYLRSLPEPLAVRSRLPLDSVWRSKFEVEQATTGTRPEPPDWHRQDLDDSDWEATTVPEWRYAEGNIRTSSSILWYRTRVAAPATAGTGQRTFLVFEGADWEAEIWLNGKRLGSHIVYYEPFRFDVTDLLKEKNTLAVRVIDGPWFGEPRANWALLPLVPAERQRYVRDRAQSIIGFQSKDLPIGNGFGIHREVYLETTGAVCLSNVFVRSSLEKQDATVTVETDAAAAGRVNVEVQILPENFEGQSYKASVTCDVPKGLGKQTLTVPMPEANLWTPETPCLYRCRVICRAGGQPAPILDAKDVLFGYRSFDIVSKQRPRDGLPDGMFLLNGKPLYLRGTNIQGLNALWYWNEQDRNIDIVMLLKAANFNAVRACHYVCYPEVRELLDRLGMMSEQDQGSGEPPANLEQLPRTGTVLARACYNNPGVVLLSFGNETHFDPTKTIEAVLAVDPQRIILPISGNFPTDRGSGYPIPDAYWANVMDDVHSYPGWKPKLVEPAGKYAHPEIVDDFHRFPWMWGLRGEIWAFSLIREPFHHLVMVGEYGGEALDGYETMAKHYPAHWKKTPPAEADTLWGHVQVRKNDIRQIVGFRGKRPKNLGQYIEASQNYQADILAEVTKGFRLSPRTIGGYFQFHFIDVMPANWPKSIVSHDLTPKKAYYAMAQVNQPLVPLAQLLDRGQAMELYAANDLPEAFSRCRIAWTLSAAGKTLQSGEKTVDVPAINAVSAGKVDLSAIPADTDVITIRLTLSDAQGKPLAQCEQEFFLRAWREQETMLKSL